MDSVLWTIVGVILCIFWVYQFVQLMLLSEVDFPGKHDKCLWTAAFLLTFPFAPFAFFGWKFAYKAMLLDSMKEPKRQEP